MSGGDDKQQGQDNNPPSSLQTQDSGAIFNYFVLFSFSFSLLATPL
jgi:hypothetical protein